MFASRLPIRFLSLSADRLSVSFTALPRPAVGARTNMTTAPMRQMMTTVPLRPIAPARPLVTISARPLMTVLARRFADQADEENDEELEVGKVPLGSR